MAQKVEGLHVEDIDGGEADETVSCSVGGTNYEIDRIKEHAAKLREGQEPVVAHARRAGRPAGRGGRATGTAGSRERAGEIREWAKGRGIKVNERGRIPANVIEQYEAAH